MSKKDNQPPRFAFSEYFWLKGLSDKSKNSDFSGQI
jgi:hypothetical protein